MHVYDQIALCVTFRGGQPVVYKQKTFLGKYLTTSTPMCIDIHHMQHSLRDYVCVLMLTEVVKLQFYSDIRKAKHMLQNTM